VNTVIVVQPNRPEILGLVSQAVEHRPTLSIKMSWHAVLGGNFLGPFSVLGMNGCPLADNDVLGFPRSPDLTGPLGVLDELLSGDRLTVDLVHNRHDYLIPMPG